MHIILRVMLVQHLLCYEVVVVADHSFGPFTSSNNLQTLIKLQNSRPLSRLHSIVGYDRHNQVLTKNSMALPNSVNMTCVDQVKAAV